MEAAHVFWLVKFLRRKPRLLLVLVAGSVLAAIPVRHFSNGSAPGFWILPLGFVEPTFAQDEKQPTQDEAFRRIQTDLDNNRLDEALQRCQEAVALDPKSSHAYYLLGLIQIERGAQDEAKQALIQSIKLDPSHIATHVELGKIYLLLNQSHEALKEFQAAVKLGDDTGSGRYGMGLALMRQSKYVEALPHLRVAAEADPKDLERLFTLIATELQLKKLDSARNHLAQIEKTHAEDGWLFFRLGKLLQQNNMSKEAEPRFNRATTLLSSADGNTLPPGMKLSDVYLQVARLHFDHHEYDEALQYLAKIGLSGLEPKVQAEVLHLQGASFLQRGKVSEAAEKMRQAAELNPSASDYFIHWAWAELLAGNMKTATTAALLAKSEWPKLPNVQMLQAIILRENTPERIRVPFSAGWHLKGEGLVCCPCKVPCPCRSNAPPTHGHCENTGAFRIKEGHYGNVRLDGFTFAAVDPSMGAEKIPSSLYVDPSASDEQVIALERIFQTFNPLRPFMFLNVKRARVSMASSAPRTIELRIPQIVEIKIQRQSGSIKEPLFRTAALDYFSNVLEYARNVTYKVWDDDGSLRWDYSGRQANFRTVDLDSSDYRDQKMLIQYGDGSGYFTEKQLELIRSQRLPTLRSYPRPVPGARNAPDFNSLNPTCSGHKMPDSN